MRTIAIFLSGALIAACGAEDVSARRQLRPVPIQRVTITDKFWGPKREVWQRVTINDAFTKFENDRGGALNNFDRVRDGLKGNHAGPPWYDGLIYEMIRGSSDFLAAHPDPELDRRLDGYIARIAAAAARNPNGYVNTYTQLEEPGHEWGLHGGFLLWQHEVYNAGALVEAAVHHYPGNREDEFAQRCRQVRELHDATDGATSEEEHRPGSPPSGGSSCEPVRPSPAGASVESKTGLAGG